MILNKCIKWLNLELINVSETARIKYEKEKIKTKPKFILN